MKKGDGTEQSNDKIMACPRDASWYRCPGFASKLHIVGDEKRQTAKCGLPALLYLDHWVEAKGVPEHMRCQRNGCKQAWPKKTVQKLG